MSEGTPLFCAAQQVPDPPSPHPHRCWHGELSQGASMRGQHWCGDPPAMPSPISPSLAQTPRSPSRPPSPSAPSPGSHPGPRLCPSQPAPAAAAAAPWRCPAGAGCAVLLGSPRPTAEGTNCPRCPRSRDRLSWSRTLPAPHSCTGSAGPARPRGQRGQLSTPSHPLVPNPLGTVLRDPRGSCEESGHKTVT